VTAACALIRRALFDDLSGFDTAFHNSYEDVDLCLRARAGGAEVHYCAESVLYHLESMSEGRFAHSAENERVFAERWVRTVERDDFRYYTEDELIGVSYENPYPLRITLSPALGTIEGSEAERRADHLLALRSRRSFEMTKEIARLNAQLLVNGKASVRRPSVQLLSAGSARWLSENPKHPRTWVLLPVRNAADRMRELLPRLYSQDAAEVVAVVAIDCGSTDDTVAVLQEFDVTILSAEGSSPAEVPLQECLLRARGEITTYEREEAAIVLGPAAIPADERWLASLLEPFDDADVAATCSRLLPANDADPLTRRRLLEATSAAEGGSIVDPGLFHGVSSAFRLDVLARFPLASGTTAAVHRWAETVLSKGQMLRHAPFSVACIESLPVIDLVAQGIAEANGNGAAADPVDLFAAVFELVREDWRHLERDLQLKGTELEHQRLDVALRRLAEAIGSRGGFGGTRSEHLWITDAAAERRAFGDWAEDA
jgi:hypothetical protein